MFEYIERFLARAWLPYFETPKAMESFSAFARMIGRDDVVPLPAQEALPTGVVVHRPGLASFDGSWRYLLRSESVDIEYRPAPGAQPVAFGDFLQHAGISLCSVARGFERNALRLAAVQEGILPELAPPELARACSRLLKFPSSLDATSAFEWDWRVCTKVRRAFGTHTEAGNTIVSVKRAAGMFNAQKEFDRLLMTTDINTEPTRTEARFTPNDIRVFFVESATWHTTLGEDVSLYLTRS